MELDNIINNFFGMSFEKQIDLLNELFKEIQSSKNKSHRIFKKMFEEYYNKISLLVKNKDSYNKLNSNQRRVLRLKTMKNLEDEATYHSSSDYDSDKEREYIYYYGSEYYLGYFTHEFNSYFRPKKISNNESEEFIEKFKKMSINDKYNIIKDFISQYSNFNEFFNGNIPKSNKIINEYNTIILNILGPELFEYYNKLNNREKISIITETAELISELESSSKNTRIIRDKDAVKKQKVLTLNNCNHFLNR